MYGKMVIDGVQQRPDEFVRDEQGGFCGGRIFINQVFVFIRYLNKFPVINSITHLCNSLRFPCRLPCIFQVSAGSLFLVFHHVGSDEHITHNCIVVFRVKMKEVVVVVRVKCDQPRHLLCSPHSSASHLSLQLPFLPHLHLLHRYYLV